MLNTLIELLDSHNHSAGSGTKIGPSGILIDGTLNMVNQILANALMVGLTSHSGSPVAGNNGSIFRQAGNLYFRNSAGVDVQLTSGNSINTSGSGELVASTPGAYPYDVVVGDAQRVLLVDTSSATTLNLPAASNAMFFMIKDISGLSRTNNISVVPDGSDTIESAAATFTLSDNFGSWGFISDGSSAWYVV